MLYEDLEKITTNSKYVTRHIVPFGFSPNGDVKEYDKIFGKLKKPGESCFVLCPECRDKDSDIYEYLHDLYNNTAGYEEKSIGSVWKYQNPSLTNAYYIYKEKDDTELYVRISDAGMYLLKTGIGLFWYELRHYKSLELMNAIEMVERLNSKIRNNEGVNDCQDEFLKVKTAVEKIDKSLSKTCEPLLSLGREYEKLKNKNHELDFIMSAEDLKNHRLENKKNLLEVLDDSIRLRLEQKNATDLKTILNFQNMMKELARPHYKIVYKENEEINPKTCVLGKWVADVLGELGCEKIEYFPGRHVDEDGTTYDVTKAAKANVELVNADAIGCIPDKSILFSYVGIVEKLITDMQLDKKEVLETAAFYMALGYDGKYKIEEHVKVDMVHPYDNIVEYVRKEGFAECVTFSEDNKAFFVSRKLRHFRTDYFHMYMHLLQQSYSILNMTKELATTLSANHELYKKEGKGAGEKLEEIEARMNLFLIKNKKASVSHVENQNVFYKYVENGLHIKEDIEALSSGVGTLGEIIMRRDAKKEQDKSEQMESAFTVLTIISMASLFGDLLGIYDLLTAENFIWTNMHTMMSVGLVVLAVIVVISARHSIIKLFGIHKLIAVLAKKLETLKN